MKSRQKGKVGEREFAALLREQGFDARRGVQFSGGSDSPDVVSHALAWLHIEIKRTQRLNLTDACAQAEGDCGGKPWIVAHRRNHAPWLITMRAELFFDLLRGKFDTSPGADAKSVRRTSSGMRPPSPQRGEGIVSDQGGEGDGARGATRPTQKISDAACAAAIPTNTDPNTDTDHED